jgi:hypothetical protein
VIVPLPSFKAGSREPLDDSEMGQERVSYFDNVDIILLTVNLII